MKDLECVPSLQSAASVLLELLVASFLASRALRNSRATWGGRGQPVTSAGHPCSQVSLPWPRCASSPASPGAGHILSPSMQPLHVTGDVVSLSPGLPVLLFAGEGLLSLMSSEPLGWVGLMLVTQHSRAS